MADRRICVRVERLNSLATDILGIKLTPVSGEALPTVDAGAHIDLILPDGLIRQYSLCNPSSAPEHYELGILNDPNSRGGSSWLHQHLKEGDELMVSAPRNHFPLVPAEHSILFAGGIGITPIRAMALALEYQQASFELHYCARSADRAAYWNDLQTGSFGGQVTAYFDDQKQKLDALSVLKSADLQSHLYCCGPSGFIDWIQQQAREAGWSDARIHFERFAADPNAELDGDAFEIQLFKSGRVIPVAADQTAAQAMMAAGVDLQVSCEQGICGSCLVPVIDGVPDHRDMYQTEQEHASNLQFTPCCSRSKSRRLVVDL